MINLTTRTFAPDGNGIAQASTLLCNGGLVAFPTETVYGLGVDARNSEAVARLYAAKGRPAFNPLIVHLPSLGAARTLVEFDEQAESLAQSFWPGALTLVLPLKPEARISPLVTAGLDTLAIRVPDHPVAQELLRATNRPIAAPSANPSGQVSPTKSAHVLAHLSGKIDGVVDGGDCTVGLESTIVTTRPEPTLLRAGGLPIEALEACLGLQLSSLGNFSAPTAPGQLSSHYAPNGTVRLNVSSPRSNEILLGFGAVDAAFNLSRAGDLTEAASRLFEGLHYLNKIDAKRIAVSPIPETGLGRAINDRLRRAAAPRDK